MSDFFYYKKGLQKFSRIVVHYLIPKLAFDTDQS